MKIYYKDQKNWDMSDYAFLQRYMSKMVEYSNSSRGSYDGRIRLEEIKELDLSLMSDKTKAILFCIVNNQKPSLFELENLKDLKNCKPLKDPLYLLPFKKTTTFRSYKDMNVIY